MGKCKLFRIWKHKAKELKIGSYLREVSVVIIGVAVTFFVSGIISDIQEKRDVKLQLNTIYIELEDNIKGLDKLIDYYADHDRLAEILIESIEHPDQLEKDSVNKYLHLVGKVISFSYKQGAYEMFVNSGAMKVVTDRNQLLDITECYSLLATTKEEHDKYINMKIQEILKLYSLEAKYMKDKIDFNQPGARSIFNFYTSVNGMGYSAGRAKKQIEETLSQKSE